MTKIILDTNAFTAYLAGDRAVFEAIVEAETVFMSVVVLGELFAGFRGGTGRARNEDALKGFLAKSGVRVVDVTVETAEIFGEIKASLRNRGTPIPLNDVWIASHAVETGAKLVTYDNHFKSVEGLRLWERAVPGSEE